MSSRVHLKCKFEYIILLLFFLKNLKFLLTLYNNSRKDSFFSVTVRYKTKKNTIEIKNLIKLYF